jgi:lipopolysaccharide/colanic/teichoic acid biosynthesis glycosyltransferase/ubiquinone/menaquinone biosynthesis C-methylase UbiE
MPLDERKQKEIEHSDRRRSIVRAYEYKTDASSDQREDKYVEGENDYERHFSNMKFYSITRSSFAYRDRILFDGIKGAVALDYCCGNGEIAIEMAKRGAFKVYGIDISSVAIENARALAKDAGVDAVCEFCVMDAEHTDFAGNTFDIIHEYGALHHLDLHAAFQELSRILKPEGKVVCTEALRHNPLIHLYRKKTPHLRTQWEVEHILGFPEIKSGTRYFGFLELKTFHLAALAAVLFRRAYFFEALLGFLNRVDMMLLSIPFLRRMAWVAVMEYREPVSANPGTMGVDDIETVCSSKSPIWKLGLKRLFDLSFSGFMLLLLWPIFILIAIAIKLTSPGPVFYRGVRSGLNGSTFRIFKFRTMVENAEVLGGPTTGSNDQRVTRFGAFLRRTKLDEIPQFLNVLAGDMSLVGPRPEVLEYASQYRNEEKIILSMRPGITDYASIEYADLDDRVGSVDPDKYFREHVLPMKNAMRVKYVKEWSLKSDFKILFQTFFVVLKKISK